MAKGETLLLMGDFETTKDKLGEYKNYKGEIKGRYKARVWASALIDIYTEELYQLTNNIDKMMYWLFDNSKKNDIELYYHNLKFDGKFIIDWLLRNGWTVNPKLNEKKNFSTLITNNGIFYQIVIKKGSSKNSCRIVIRDSLKIIPLPVKAIAKAYNMPISKGEIDYDLPRHEDWQITEEEEDYILKDVKIVAKALREHFKEGHTKMTASSNAMEHFQTLIGKKKFRGLFPTLDMRHNEEESVDDFIRKSYKGGFTYVNPKFKGKPIKEFGQTYDVNSLYPSVMYNELLPVGMPLYFKGQYQHIADYPLYIQRLKCKFKIKKGFIPTIQLKNNSRFMETEYITNSGTTRVELTLTNIDLDLFFNHYDVWDVDYIEGYCFNGKLNIFKEYIDFWSAIKKNNEGGLRQLAKLMLNSLYGKFCSSTEREIKQPYLGDDNIVHFEEDFGSERSSIYTAMGSFITSYARRVTITAFQENIDICCYADTDSIHIIGDKPKNIKIDSKELGYWKHECNWIEGKFLRPKTYFEVSEEGHIDLKACGMPQTSKEIFIKKIKDNNLDIQEEFRIGLKVGGKLVPVSCEGGVYLEERLFTIK